MLFDAFYHNSHVWVANVLQIEFYRDFPDFVNFAAFLDHTKEIADVSKNEGQS